MFGSELETFFVLFLCLNFLLGKERMADEFPECSQVVNLVNYDTSDDEGKGFFGSQLNQTLAVIDFDPEQR